MRDFIPNFENFLEEGALTNYRKEKEGQKITGEQLVGTFDEVIHKLIEERIPFYFDCSGNGFKRIGYLMNERINGKNFDGYILDSTKSTDFLCKEFTEKICRNISIEKPGKLFVGRTDFADLQNANDIDTITVVVKAFKNYPKDKGIQDRVITGNKYEARINIDFLCDTNTRNNIIEFVF